MERFRKMRKGRLKFICFVCLIWSVNGCEESRKGALWRRLYYGRGSTGLKIKWMGGDVGMLEM